MDAEVVSRYKQWAKVLFIKESKTKMSVRGVGDIGYSTSWLIAVKVKNKTPKLNLTVGPPPKTGDCIPIIANELSNGNIIVSIDDAEWRYGTEFGSCD